MIPYNEQIVKDFLQGKNPNGLYEMLMKNNPQFARFVNENKNLTPEQITQKYGIDPSLLKLFNIERK